MSSADVRGLVVGLMDQPRGWRWVVNCEEHTFADDERQSTKEAMCEVWLVG